MTYIQTIHSHLKDDPKTGIIAGLSSGALIRIQQLLTDDLILKVVAGVGTWCSALLSLLALVVWVIKRFERNRSTNNKIKQHEKISDQPLEEN